MKLQSSFLILLLATIGISNASSDTPGIIWTSTGGGWRSMAASTAYAQVFSNLGMLGGGGDSDTTKISSVATTSGSSWWSAQFFFSKSYYDTIVNGTPESLGEFTSKWLAAYASSQENITLGCADGPLQEICDKLADEDSFKKDLAVLSLAAAFNYSWPNIVYAMYDAAAQTYDDEEFVSVKASSDKRLSELADIDMCFHTSLLPNARAKEVNTITYLGENSEDASTSWTVPLPYDWCLNDGTEEWSSSFPGGNVYPAPSSFVGSDAYKGYPMFPPTQETSTLQVTPAGNLTSTLSAEDMSPPFGGVPTAVQISTASSSTVGYLSEDAVTYFAQYMSLIRAGLESSSSYTIEQKVELKELLDKTQEIMWETGLLANAATNSAWTKPNPIDMPPALDTSYWFTDGGYTDGPASAIALGRHQKTYGTDQEIKLIISNNNYITNSMNNVLAYFNTTWNTYVKPGDFIWPAGVGSDTTPQYNPQRSNQIFKETMTEDMLKPLFSPINGTNLTSATISATTVDNPAYGIVAGQKVKLLWLNINSNIPTFLITAPMINGYTPGVVEMVEGIAGSQALEDVISEFAGASASSASDEGTDEPAEGGVAVPSGPETTASDSSALGIFKFLGLVLIGVSIVIS